MEEVIERSDIDYTPDQLRGMISSKKLEGTEIFTVTVTADDPYEAAHIANSISEVLPHRVEDIIDGSSMRIVDSAVVQPGKISPNITQKTAIGFVFGCALAAALIVLITMFDDTIRDEDYLSDNYPLPILSCIPDLNGTASNDKYKYGYAQSHQQGRRDE